MPTGPVRDPGAWVRPSDWLPLPSVIVGDDKIVGLFAVYDGDSNWIGLTISSAYTVDWGDGATTSHAAGSTAQRNILWSNVSSSTLTSGGYRQAIVTITPQAGQQLTSVVLSATPIGVTVSATNWLDIRAAAPYATTLTVSNPVRSTFLERFEMVGPTALTTAANMFSFCRSLQSIPLFDTANVTTFENMFFNCLVLQSVPLFNTANGTTMTQMFATCLSLKSVPLFDTAKVTSMSNMFINCNVLQSVPLFNTANVTTITQMFANCFSLKSVPLFDTANVTTMAGVFFAAPLIDLPLFDTRKVFSFAQIFQSCRNLKSVPMFDMRVTTTALATNGCSHLQRFDPIARRSITIGSTTIGSFTKLSPEELDRVYTRLPSLLARTITNAAGNGTTVTYTTSIAHNYLPGMVISMTGITPSAYNLATQTITDCPTPTTFTIANAATGAYVSGGTATPAGATITVTGNWGTISDNPTIATAKGWTVTG